MEDVREAWVYGGGGVIRKGICVCGEMFFPRDDCLTEAFTEAGECGESNREEGEGSGLAAG